MDGATTQQELGGQGAPPTPGIFAAELDKALRWAGKAGDVPSGAWFFLSDPSAIPAHCPRDYQLKMLAEQLLKKLRLQGCNVAGELPCLLALATALCFCRVFATSDDLGYYAYLSVFAGDAGDADDSGSGGQEEILLEAAEMLEEHLHKGKPFLECFVLAHTTQLSQETYLRVLARAYCCRLVVGSNVIEPNSGAFEVLKLVCGQFQPTLGPHVQLFYQQRIDGSAETQFVMPLWKEDSEKGRLLDELDITEASGCGTYAAPTDALAYERYDSIRKAFAKQMPRQGSEVDAWERGWIETSFELFHGFDADDAEDTSTDLSFKDAWIAIRTLFNIFQWCKRVQWKGRLLLPRHLIHPYGEDAAQDELARLNNDIRASA
eukprot:scaffold1540_cov181-Pinguiococcus_pyrenoidosus.AAC.4